MPIVGTYACGANGRGQLGDGTTTGRLTVVPIQLPTWPVDVAIGNTHTLAVLEDGTVWAWGENSTGQLGDGTTTRRLSPVQVLGLGGGGYLSDVVAVAASGGLTFADPPQGYSLALAANGEVWAWGVNQYGQLGDGTQTTRNTPVKVVNMAQAVAVAAGGGHSYIGGYPQCTSYALTADGYVFAWGYDGRGQCGQGSTASSRIAPVQVQSLEGVIAIAAGASSVVTDYQGGCHALALREDGTVWAWGLNSHGQVGPAAGGLANPLPVQVTGLSDIVAIAAGGMGVAQLNEGGHSLALRADGTVWAWGYNAFGQLGDGTTTSRSTPAQVSGLTDVVGVYAVGHSSIARKADGTFWAWGLNNYGQLGDGGTTNRLTPVQVVGINSSTLAWKCAKGPGAHSIFMLPHPGKLHFTLGDVIRKTVSIGRILAGETLGPRALQVWNFCPSAVSGVKATRLGTPPEDVVEISATRDPFVAEDPVYLSGTFGPSERIGTVWVRVKPPILVDGQPNQGLKQFTLRATNAQ